MPGLEAVLIVGITIGGGAVCCVVKTVVVAVVVDSCVVEDKTVEGSVTTGSVCELCVCEISVEVVAEIVVYISVSMVELNVVGIGVADISEDMSELSPSMVFEQLVKINSDIIKAKGLQNIFFKYPPPFLTKMINLIISTKALIVNKTQK